MNTRCYALLLLVLTGLLAGQGSTLAAAKPHPLEPLDTSSPRATLSSFLADVDEVWRIYRDQYWHSPSKELDTRINHIAARVLRTLDLSQVAPSARVEAGYDAGTIPNERMASLDIENIGRRNFIRRQTNITISYGTPPDKIEKAVSIIKDILEDHQGMRPELPPRVYFNEFNRDSLNIQVSYWYHPPRRWKSLAFDERVNLEIVRRFNAEGIEFAFPTSTTYVTQKDGKSLQLSIAGDAPLKPP